MRRNKLLLVVAFVCCSNLLSAQTSTTELATATIDANYCLTISDDNPIQEFYAINISALGFENEQEAKKVFGMKSNNLITYTVEFENNRVVAHLHLDRLNETKDKAWWSSYLLDTCERY